MLSRRTLVPFLLVLLCWAFCQAEEAALLNQQDGSSSTTASATVMSFDDADSQSDQDDVALVEGSDEPLVDLNAVETETNASTSTDTKTESSIDSDSQQDEEQQRALPAQSGPLIDLFGPQLLSLEMIDETHAQLQPQLTNEALQGKQVIGLYFSADWCGPCRQFTPELLTFYQKMNARKGKQDQFQIVWVSRCRDMESYGQYFAKMPGWLALPPQEAMGERGRWLGDKYKVKSIPTLVLLDDLGQVIVKDARTKIPADRAGVGFPWRNPLANIYLTLIPRSVRFMIKSQVASIKDKVGAKLKTIVHPKSIAKVA